MLISEYGRKQSDSAKMLPGGRSCAYYSTTKHADVTGSAFVCIRVARLCCANAMKDSHRESSLLVRPHEQTEAPHLPHRELA